MRVLPFTALRVRLRSKDAAMPLISWTLCAIKTQAPQPEPQQRSQEILPAASASHACEAAPNVMYEKKFISQFSSARCSRAERWAAKIGFCSYVFIGLFLCLAEVFVAFLTFAGPTEALQAQGAAHQSKQSGQRH